MWHSRFTLQSISVFSAFEVADVHMSMMGSAVPTTYRQLQSHRPQVHCIQRISQSTTVHPCLHMRITQGIPPKSQCLGCIPGQLNQNLLGWYPDTIFFKVPRCEVKNKNKHILKHLQLRFMIDRSLNAFKILNQNEASGHLRK